LPFAGCRARCVFCAQDRQSGAPAASGGEEAVSRALDALEAELERRVSRRLPPAEVAFYGGTFTAQPDHLQDACLKRLFPWRERGAVRAARCSTRPDALDAALLGRLKTLGLDAVELGVQSFSSRALLAAGRGYDRARALDACALVREAGLSLGVQLMPGMPGTDGPSSSPFEIFREDVELALAARADFLRCYPCLVLRGTELESAWRAGRYRPLSLEETIAALAEALLAAGRRGVPIIRMGLPLGREFVPHILAGPAHPSLGASVQAEALFAYLEPHCARAARREGGISLRLPPWCRGFFRGERGGMRRRWASLGLHEGNVFWDAD
jgi:histone acetyltransferase (RNA polymerase elongator complex component)